MAHDRLRKPRPAVVSGTLDALRHAFTEKTLGISLHAASKAASDAAFAKITSDRPGGSILRSQGPCRREAKVCRRSSGVKEIVNNRSNRHTPPALAVTTQDFVMKKKISNDKSTCQEIQN
jgi:hypothetical protein